MHDGWRHCVEDWASWKHKSKCMPSLRDAKIKHAQHYVEVSNQLSQNRYVHSVGQKSRYSADLRSRSAPYLHQHDAVRWRAVDDGPRPAEASLASDDRDNLCLWASWRWRRSSHPHPVHSHSRFAMLYSASPNARSRDTIQASGTYAGSR